MSLLVLMSMVYPVLSSALFVVVAKGQASRLGSFSPPIKGLALVLLLPFVSL
jgi:hypothetical protein